jgi:hypothetical protein
MFQLSENDGIRVTVDRHPNVTRTALTSLRTAIRSFFELYQVTHQQLKPETLSKKQKGKNRQLTEESITDLCRMIPYQEKYLQVIFHFHHFFELFAKDVLFSVHPSLGMKFKDINLTNNSETILKILNGESVEAIVEKNTTEFTNAIERVITLPVGTSPVSEIFKRNKAILSQLNDLRNRAWHRGLYILKYPSLVQFIGTNIFPLMLECVETPHFSGLKHYWSYNNIHEGHDPILKIMAACRANPVNFKQIAFYMAYGRACYNVPTLSPKLHRLLKQPEARAKGIESHCHGVKEVKKCFVCGTDSLVVYEDSDHEIDDNGDIIDAWWFTTNVECTFCELDLYHDAGDPHEYGLTDETLWT